ncbi:MAG TPA: peroxiredoxin [Bacteroidia bacterium]|nr:peroxiredoxin [Bacteroidia bacterium]
MRKHLAIACFSLVFAASCTSQSHQLDVGNKIPLFSLKDQDGKTFNMKDSIGNNIFVIFFYPKDESAVCTKEACGFRDSLNIFKQLGIEVIGINQGSVESHKKFQQHDSLNYELLSDPDEKVIKQFGVNGMLLTDRVTYVVDITGQIVFKYHSMTEGKKHVHEALDFIRQLKKKQGE